MAVETLGEAHDLGWRLTARCALGRKDGMKSIAECMWKTELCMTTLLATRGRGFPLSDLPTRLMCPRCGTRKMALIYDLPSEPQRMMGRMIR